MAPSYRIPQWNPTPKQKALFDEWKSFCVGFLVSSREGVKVRQIPHLLEEHVGEPIPLTTMGIRGINQFIYLMEEDIDLRKLDSQLYLFINERMVPPQLQHIRDLVLGQAKSKSCKSKTTGKILRPTRHQTVACTAEELLQQPFASTRRFTAPLNTHRPPSVTIRRSPPSNKFAVHNGSHGRSSPRASKGFSPPSASAKRNASQIAPLMQVKVRTPSPKKPAKCTNARPAGMSDTESDDDAYPGFPQTSTSPSWKSPKKAKVDEVSVQPVSRETGFYNGSSIRNGTQPSVSATQQNVNYPTPLPFPSLGRGRGRGRGRRSEDLTLEFSPFATNGCSGNLPLVSLTPLTHSSAPQQDTRSMFMDTDTPVNSPPPFCQNDLSDSVQRAPELTHLTKLPDASKDKSSIATNSNIQTLWNALPQQPHQTVGRGRGRGYVHKVVASEDSSSCDTIWIGVSAPLFSDLSLENIAVHSLAKDSLRIKIAECRRARGGKENTFCLCCPE